MATAIPCHDAPSAPVRAADLLEDLPGSVPFSVHLAKENARARLERAASRTAGPRARSSGRAVTSAPTPAAPRTPSPPSPAGAEPPATARLRWAYHVTRHLGSGTILDVMA